jgi:ketopantoate reductase
VREACAVALAEGAKVDAESVLRGKAMPAGMRSSMQKDVERTTLRSSRRSQGRSCAAQRRHGIEVPATKKLVAAVEQRAGYVENRLG